MGPQFIQWSSSAWSSASRPRMTSGRALGPEPTISRSSSSRARRRSSVTASPPGPCRSGRGRDDAAPSLDLPDLRPAHGALAGSASDCDFHPRPILARGSPSRWRPTRGTRSDAVDPSRRRRPVGVRRPSAPPRRGRLRDDEPLAVVLGAFVAAGRRRASGASAGSRPLRRRRDRPQAVAAVGSPRNRNATRRSPISARERHEGVAADAGVPVEQEPAHLRREGRNGSSRSEVSVLQPSRDEEARPAGLGVLVHERWRRVHGLVVHRRVNRSGQGDRIGPPPTASRAVRSS